MRKEFVVYQGLFTHKTNTKSTMNSNLISIIVPVYNVEQYLSRCIDSLLNQTFQNIEIILVNDGSTDSSGKICDIYADEDKRVKVIHKQNGGLSSARNAGLKIATGSYIGFVDSDDWVCPDMYDSLYTLSKKNDNSIACGLLTYTDDQMNQRMACTIYKEKKEFNHIEYIQSLLLHKGDASVCTKLFPSSIFTTHLFKENRLNEDFIFMIDLAFEGWGISISDRALYNYFSRPGSISHSYGKNIMDMVVNAFLVKKRVKKNYPELLEESYRFTFVQASSFLLLVPIDMSTRERILFMHSLKFLRKNIFKRGVCSRLLSMKQRIIICMLAAAPRITKKIREILS